MMGRYLRGKRVACVSPDKGDRVWAEYAVIPARTTLPLDKSVDMDRKEQCVAKSDALATGAKDIVD